MPSAGPIQVGADLFDAIDETDLLTKLNAKGIIAVYHSEHNLLSFLETDQTLTKVKIASSTVKLADAQSLKPFALDGLKQLVVKAAHAALKMAGFGDVLPEGPKATPTHPGDAPADPTQASASKPKWSVKPDPKADLWMDPSATFDKAKVSEASADKSVGIEELDMSKVFQGDLETGERVKLRDATLLYQPVYSTSAGSRYFCVGVAESLKAAARWHGTQLSIRVEGNALLLQSFRKLLTGKVGMEKAGEEYASMHLSVSDEYTARKALGSVLLAMTHQWETPWPDVTKIKGKGA